SIGRSITFRYANLGDDRCWHQCEVQQCPRKVRFRGQKDNLRAGEQARHRAPEVIERDYPLLRDDLATLTPDRSVPATSGFGGLRTCADYPPSSSATQMTPSGH